MDLVPTAVKETTGAAPMAIVEWGTIEMVVQIVQGYEVNGRQATRRWVALGEIGEAPTGVRIDEKGEWPLGVLYRAASCSGEAPESIASSARLS